MKNTKKLLALVLGLILSLSLSFALMDETWDNEKLNQYLLEISESVQDGWQKAIYEAGAKELSLENNVLSFNLRGFMPTLTQLPKMEDDPQVWEEKFFENIMAYNVKASLVISNGEATKDSVNKLKSLVANQANKAKEAFSNQNVKGSALDLISPNPYKDSNDLKSRTLNSMYLHWVKIAGLEHMDQKLLSTLMYAQQGRNWNLNNGPHAIEVTVKYIAPSLVLQNAKQEALDYLSTIEKANAYSTEQIIETLEKYAFTQATKLRKDNSYVRSYIVDIDKVGEHNWQGDFGEFLIELQEDSQINELIEKTQALPDYPAKPFPKSGRISGTTSGTKLIIKGPNDEFARYVQVRRASDDAFMVDLFIRPGESATVYAPQGESYILVSSGTVWYGTEAMFLEQRFSRTESFEIMPSNYYHTITLGGVTNGNMDSWAVDPSAFNK